VQSNIIIVIILSIILPGSGHFFLGIRKRGFQIILLFLTLRFLKYVFGNNLFGSIFDLATIFIYVYFLIEAIRYNIAIERGAYIADIPIMNNFPLEATNKSIGILLIIAGTILLLNYVFSLPLFDDISYIYEQYIKKSILPFIMIIIGVYLLKYKK